MRALLGERIKGEFNNWVISLLVTSLSNISHIAYLMRYLVLEKSKGENCTTNHRYIEEYRMLM